MATHRLAISKKKIRNNKLYKQISIPVKIQTKNIRIKTAQVWGDTLPHHSNSNQEPTTAITIECPGKWNLLSACLLICQFFWCFDRQIWISQNFHCCAFLCPGFTMKSVCLSVIFFFLVGFLCDDDTYLLLCVSSNNKFQQTPDILSHLTSPHDITASEQNNLRN